MAVGIESAAARGWRDAYLDLFKRYNVTIPGGSCVNVGAGDILAGAAMACCRGCSAA